MIALSPEQLSAISRLFSSTLIREIARRGKSPLFATLAAQSGLVKSGRELVRRLFDDAFAVLSREGYRHEYIYKSALTQKILLGRHSLRTASMLTEFRVGNCKADLVILNGTATVYEIKSERDSLSRLEYQIDAYRKVFAEVFVIAASDYVSTVLDSVPRDVGVLRLNHRNQISIVRDARDRSSFLSPAAIFDSIRTEEARLVLHDCGVSLPSLPNTQLNSALRELFIKLDAAQAHAASVRVLKRTRNLSPLSELVHQLPRSLHTAALSVPLRKADHSRLLTAVNTRLDDAIAWS